VFTRSKLIARSYSFALAFFMASETSKIIVDTKAPYGCNLTSDSPSSSANT
jgi:hypothetical protein